MKVSYSWLQDYIDGKLPSAEDVAEQLSLHAFEVEGIDVVDGNEKILDIDVLPNRASDSLSHIGIAREICAVLDIPRKNIDPKVISISSKVEVPKITVSNTQLCRRYMARRVDGVTVGQSPEWLSRRLASIGQKSINNIVDATNYVMFEYGQPLHAFDADKVDGQITIRNASSGEKFTTLDNKEIELSSDMLVIADDEGILALAGIKGGKKAEVTTETKNIILESANFTPANIRRTSTSVGVRTDSSKRFENNISPLFVGLGMNRVTEIISNTAIVDGGGAGEIVDVYNTPQEDVSIPVSFEKINKSLGIEITKEEVKKIFDRLGFGYSEQGNGLMVNVPLERLDITMEADVIEEIGRIYGYDKTPTILIGRNVESEENTLFELCQKLREIALLSGFNEIYGYTFREKGEVKLANPLAKDRPFLRTNLTEEMIQRVVENSNYVLFDKEPVKIFEIGSVFPKFGDEEIRMTLAVNYKKPKFDTSKEDIDDLLKKITEEIFVHPKISEHKLQSGLVIEFSLSTISKEVNFKSGPNLRSFINPNVKYQEISQYPSIVRDIALFVPEGTKAEEVEEKIKAEAGELLVIGPVLFDEFHKDGQVSLAFRMVFQSFERTLSDDEVNQIMNKIIATISQNLNWQVRD